jgi:transcriptional regulator with XRE-family HTH domain
MAGVGRTPVRTVMPIDERATFGELLKRWRRSKGLNQDQVATSASTDKSTVSEIENGRIPGHDLAPRLIAAVGAPPEPFLRALGYPVGMPIRTLDAAIAAVMELSIPEDEKQAIITLLRAMVTVT